MADDVQREEGGSEREPDPDPGSAPSELGANAGGGPRVDQGSSSGSPGISGTLTSDFRPEHDEKTPRTPERPGGGD